MTISRSPPHRQLIGPPSMHVGLLAVAVMLHSIQTLCCPCASEKTYPCTFHNGEIRSEIQETLSSAADQAAEALRKFAETMGPDATDGVMAHVLQVAASSTTRMPTHATTILRPARRQSVGAESDRRDPGRTGL
eukprot:7375932-Prymnesium_polylepis.1